MKIAIVGYFDFYGSMAVWTADSFEDNGHEVTRVDRKAIMIPSDTQVELYVDCSEDFSKVIPDKSPAIRVAWLLDSHMPYGAERSVNIARKCDLVFSSNYEHGVKILEKFGIESYLLPITYSERYFDMRGLTKEKYDVCMIGNPNSPERIKLWEFLNANYNAFTGKADTPEDYMQAINRSRIIVNQPTEPWNNILNNRFFEGMASTFGLVMQKTLTTELPSKLGFEEGIHYVKWDDLDELKRQMDYFLERSKSENGKNQGYIKYKKIKDASKRKVQQYSMRNQVAKMEQIIISKFYDRL